MNMAIVDLKLVRDYINGEDIDYDVDELENNPRFMLNVLRLSRDPNMYSLCSDNVKNNYDFVLGVIDCFSDIDFDFVKEVAGNYLDSLKLCKREVKETEEEFLNRIRHMEVDILVSSKKEEVNRFTVSRVLMASKEEALMERMRNKFMETGEFKDFGLGFLLIIDRYASSKIITDFFADRLLRKIFYCNDDDSFEELIHRNCVDPNLVMENGVNNFLLDIIGKKDTYLLAYLQNDLSLLNGIKDELGFVFDNWDRYMTSLNRKRTMLFEDVISSYLAIDDRYSVVSGDALVKYATDILQLRDVFLEYDVMYDDTADIAEFDNNDMVVKKSKKFALDFCRILFETNVINGSFSHNDIGKSNVVNISDYRGKGSK